MFKKFLSIVTIALTLTATNVAADASRARIMIPTSTTAENSSTGEKGTISGYSLHYVSSMGLGAGLTSAAVEIGTTTTSADFLDISYTFGETFTTQVAYQYPYGGKLEDSTNSVLKYKSISGQAFSLSFGYDFGGLEGLIGFMSESTKQKWGGTMIFTAANGQTIPISTEGEYERDQLVTSVGVGFTF
jgi:hypothetical protein